MFINVSLASDTRSIRPVFSLYYALFVWIEFKNGVQQITPRGDGLKLKRKMTDEGCNSISISNRNHNYGTI